MSNPPFASRRRPIRRATSPHLLMALEPRIMFDAAAVTTAVDPHSDVPVTAPADAAIPADASTPQAPSDKAALFDLGTTTPSLQEAASLAKEAIRDFLATPAGESALPGLFGAQTSSAWQENARTLRQDILDGRYSIQVQSISTAEIGGVYAAYAAHGPDGRPTIFVNQDWLSTHPAPQAVSRILVEEFGHSLDTALNGGRDTAGDEGEAFASAILSLDLSNGDRERIAAEDDHSIIHVGGVGYEVEEAAVTFVALYTGTPSAWSEEAQSLNNLQTVSGSNFKFTSAEPGAPYFSGNNVSGTLSYKDGGGNAVSIFGVVSRLFKTGSTVEGFYFYAPGTDGQIGNHDAGETAYAFVRAGYTGSFSVGANEGTSSDPVDTMLNSLIVANSAPVAANDTATVTEDGSVTGNVLTNDTDANNNTLTVTQFVVSGTTHAVSSGSSATANITNVGNLTIGSDGSYTFTPAANYTGAVPAATYTVSDGSATATATLSIAITAVNDAPTSTNDTVSMQADTTVTLALSDFGTYGDTEGSSLAKIKITALESAGTLEYFNGTSWADVTQNQEFTVTDINSGKLRYAPASGSSGSPYATIGFKVSDGTDYSTSAYTLTVNVNQGNRAPVANADTAPDAIETGVSVAGTNPAGNVLSNDTDADTTVTPGTTHKVTSAINTAASATTTTVTSGTTSTSSPASVSGLYGTLKIGADGSYIYEVNNSNASVQALRTTSNTLTEVFTYTVADASSATATSTLTVVIKGSNDAPVAVDDYDAVQETALSGSYYGTSSGNVLPNDTDVDSGDSKTVSGSYAAATGSTAGSVTITFTGNGLSSVSNGDYVYIDTDGSASTNGTLLTVNSGTPVTAIKGDSGITLSHPNATTSNDQGVTIGSGSYLGFCANNPISGNYKVATVNAAQAPSSTTVNVSGITGAINAGMSVTNGTDTRTVSSLTFDGSGNVTQITVNSAVAWPGVGLTFSATPSTTLTGRYGQLTLGSDGAYTYNITSTTLNTNETFTEKFSYRLSDTGSATDDGMINVVVSGTTNPVLSDDAVTVAEDSGAYGSGASNVLTNDTGSSLAVTGYSWGGQTANAGNSLTLSGIGTLTVNANGTFTFDPVDNYTGAVPVVTYNAQDGSSTASATLAITISASNDAPTSTNDSVTTPEDTTLTLSLTDFGVYSDVEGTAIAKVKITTLESNGSLEYNNSGSWDGVTQNQEITAADITAGKLRFVPDADENGSPYATIGFMVGDGTDYSAGAYTLTVNVTPVNDAPVNTVPGAQTLSDYQTLTFSSGLSVDDVDDNIANVSLSVANGSLAATVNGSGSVSGSGSASSPLVLSGTKAEINTMLASLVYTPTAGFSGGDTLRVVTTDTGGLSDTDYVGMTVNTDSRALAVTGTTVNEASPYVLFSVAGQAGQRVTLSLGTTGSGTGHATSGGDFLPNLEYYNGSTWTAYNGGTVTIPGSSGAATLLVRTAVLQDTLNEGAETLQLTASNSAGTAYSANSTIKDDGSGSIFLASNTTATPNASGNSGYPANLDDDRLLTINDIQVNESSTYAVFTVEGATDQTVTISLQGATATVGTDTGSGLEYYNGSAWQTYGSAVAIPADGKLFVRTTITSDSTYEGPESFALKATNTGGGATTGTALILDDGTGTKYTGTISGSTPDSNTSSLDDDRTLTVTSPTVNEASGYTVFTVTGNAGQQVTLTLGNDNDSNTTNATLGTDTAATSTLEVWNSSTSTWVTYDANDKPITPGSSGTGDLLVRLAVTNDATYEGAETLTLTAAYVAGGSKEGTGTATIKDDGTGTKYPGTVSNGTPDSNTSSLDNDTPTVSVSSVTVSEASPYAVFTVSLDHASTGAISFTPSLTNGTATVGTDTGNSIEYYNGSSWTSAASGITLAAGSTSVLVRAAITNDTTYEGSETFTLSTGTITGTVTNSGAATGTGTIKDDGSSTNVFLSSNNSATPTTGTADDDRAITVTSPTVNENSPYAVFTVAGTSGQSITLALAAGTATGSGTDYGASGASNLEVSTNGGSSWTSYSSAVTVPAGNSFLVRTPVIDDAVADNGETFTLTATPAGGTAVIGTATIKDDGTGTLYNADGTTNSSGTLDDDRPLAVSDVTVSEASPYAVFTVSGTAGQSITLALVSGTATVGTDTGAGLQYLDGSTWTTYSGAVTLPAGGQLLVRTSIANDSTYEGAETFKLRATNTGGTSFDGTGTLKDDGSSTNVFLSGNNSAAPTTGTADNDADTTPPTVALSAPTATLALGEATTVTLRFSEVPFGLSIGDFSISGGTLSGLVQSLVDPKVWTATFTQTGTGAPALSLRAASYTDEAGNGGGAGSLDFQLVLPPPLPEPTPPKVEPTIMPPAPPTPPATPATPVIDSVRPPAPPPTVDLSPVPVTPPVTPLPAEAPPVISPPPLVPSTSTPLISLPVTTMGMGPVMDAQLLVVTNPGPQQAQTGKDATFQLPAGVFRHTDPTARTKVEATLIDGQPLPDWLKFDPGTGKFSGTPPEGTSRSVDIKVTAQDDRGNTAGVQFALHVSETTRPPALTVPAAPARPVAEPAIAAPQPAAPSISPPETVTRPPVVTPQGASPQLGVVTVVDAGAAPGGVNLFVAIQPTAQEVSTGKELAYQLPTGTFRHTDTNARTQLEATQTDGRPLPGWLSFDPGTGKFSGVPPEGARGVLDVKVVARDNTGQEATVQFRIRVTNLPDAQPAPEGQEAPAGEETRKTLPPRTEATDDGGALADAGETGAPRPAKGRPASVISLPGRPSLQEQMARFGRQGQERDYGDLLRHLKSLAAANARSLAA